MAAAFIYVTGSFWFSAAAMAASRVTLRVLRESDYLEHTIGLGESLRTGLAEAARRHDISFVQTGPVQMPLFLFGDDPDFRRGFFWCEQMLQQGIYMHPWHNMFINAAMTEADIAATLVAADQAFGALAKSQGSLPANERLEMLFAAQAME
jgi:glutamate-1-semialdehyde 2,1-aminomutase